MRTSATNTSVHQYLSCVRCIRWYRKSSERMNKVVSSYAGLWIWFSRMNFHSFILHTSEWTNWNSVLLLAYAFHRKDHIIRSFASAYFHTAFMIKVEIPNVLLLRFKCFIVRMYCECCVLSIKISIFVISQHRHSLMKARGTAQKLSSWCAECVKNIRLEFNFESRCRTCCNLFWITKVYEKLTDDANRTATPPKRCQIIHINIKA